MSSQSSLADPEARIAALESALSGCQEELARTRRERDQSLEQQTAIADVLAIINRSTGDVEPALNVVCRRARDLAQGNTVRLYTLDGSHFITRAAAFATIANPERRALIEVTNTVGNVSTPEEGDLRLVALRRGEPVHMWGDRAQWEAAYPGSTYWWDDTPLAQGAEARVTALSLPLLRDGVTLGVLSVMGSGEPFPERVVTVLKAFADQAGIAIENARLFDEVQQKNRELAGALEQQTATNEVLQIISSSPADLGTVLQAVAEQAARICDASDATIARLTGDVYRTEVHYGDLPLVARVGEPRSWAETLARGRSTITAAITERRTIHLPDLQAPEADDYPLSRDLAARLGQRTSLIVPILHEGDAIGVIMIRRVEQRPFTERQIAMLETFASQAAIAIENARLYEELQARTRELEERNREQAEALEREQATADVLRVISRSPDDLDASLQAVADAAVRICRADFARVWLRDGDDAVRGPGASPAGIEYGRPGERLVLADRQHAPFAASILTGRLVHAADMHAYAEEIQASYLVTAMERVGLHTQLSVPLLRGSTSIGALVFARGNAEPAPFSEREIALAETFADQAVIAIENARLFNELQASNATLREALEQQTATSEVLSIISRSPTELPTVLQAVIVSAAQLCNAETGTVAQMDGDRITAVYRFNPPPELAGSGGPRDDEMPLDGQTFLSRAFVERAPVHLWGEPEEIERSLSRQFPYESTRYARAMLAVPLLRGGEPVGVMGIVRRGPTPFTDQQIALLQTFADQAVIAIENARLFDKIQDKNRELVETLEYQTATAEILEIISQSPTDVQPVLDAIVQRARALGEGDRAVIWRIEGDEQVRWASTHAQSLGLRLPMAHTRYTGQVVRERRTIHIPHASPISEEQRHQWETLIDAPGISPPYSSGYVPLLRDETVVAVMGVVRTKASAFTDKQIALLQTFADQAVIAIENARLFEEIQQRTRELEAASRAKSEFLSRMSHELRTPLNAIIGFAEIMELDPVTTARQHERVRHILQGGRHLLGLINEVLDITRIEAGHLSLSLEPVRLDAVVQEVFDLERPLAAEAEVTLALDDPDAFRVAVVADRQRLRQVVLNLVANAIKYNQPGGSVTLSVSSGRNEHRGKSNEGGPVSTEQQAIGDQPRGEDDLSLLVDPSSLLRLTVHDTGQGIAADQLDRLFEPFERLSAEGSGVEGTGLGLAIARGLTEAMGGTIGVESAAREGSVFWIELPEAAGLPSLPLADDLAGSDADDGEAHPATVLYIEDNQPNIDLVRDALAFRPGVTLLVAPDGATGIRIAARYQPHLILLDLNLPDLQGDEVLTRLRAEPRTAAIPVVMVSADATAGQIDRLLAAGARAYLTKPLDVRRFLALVDELTAADGG